MTSHSPRFVLLARPMVAVLGLITSLVAGTGSSCAQTVLLNPLNVTTTNFTYGDLSFAVTSCNFISLGATTSCASDGLEIESVSNDRGGTEIEVAPTIGSLVRTAGLANTSLTFGLKITDLAGSHGISSVSNILSAAVANAADDSLLTSVLSGFNVGASPASISSQPGALSSVTSFTLTSGTVSFNVALNLDTSTAQTADVLTLNSVKLLFQPAPEPASGVLL